jgi:signal transduction histidine kinase
LAIKLKKFSHSTILKTIIFILTITCFTGSLSIIEGLFNSETDPSIIFQDNYYESDQYIDELQRITRHAIYIITKHESRDKILSGESISEEEYAQKEYRLYLDFVDNSSEYHSNLASENGHNRYKKSYNYKIFKKVYADKIEQMKKELIEEELRHLELRLNYLNKIDGLMYKVSDGKNSYYNTSENKDFFKSQPSYLINDSKETSIFPENIKNNPLYNELLRSIEDDYTTDNISVYIALTNDYLNDNILDWITAKESILKEIYILIILAVVLLLCLIYLIIVIGKKSYKDNKIYFNIVDKIYTDINIVACLSLILFWGNILYYHYYYDDVIFTSFIFPISTFILGSICLILVLSLIKHIKNNTLIKHTLIFIILEKLNVLIKNIYNNGNMGIKAVLIVIAYPIILALPILINPVSSPFTVLLIPVTMGVALWLAIKKVGEFNKIKDGVEKIKDGDVYHKIEPCNDKELAKLALNINSIADGLNKSIDNELKSQRLKTELISNVSHDIRTPLTSIITYIDLLKKEGLNSENALEYLDVLEQKSSRLKTLTDDLFEASKASSGDIPVNIEQIDVTSLINQTMGELNDKILISGLDFRINYPSDNIYVKADGKLLWRVIENIMSNILKYALPNSRVYIDVLVSDNTISIIFKNISSYELNIDSYELMERFKRGDESRNSEGSGLGLSIAKSLVELQNGKFNIKIDGDLFKVIIVLPKYSN